METPGIEFWNFVKANLDVDPSKLRLKYHNHSDMGFDVSLAITQIECRKKFGKKLSETLAEDPEFLFASVLAGEQSTSDSLARFHASLIGEDADLVADLTAGLGIDVFHVNARRIIAIELDEARAEALKYNVANLHKANIQVFNEDCRDFIANYHGAKFDAIFIDPARRADDGSRVYALAQCRPDVIEMLPRIKEIAKRLIVKMSPMLDISKTLSELPDTARIIALGTTTECRELISVCDFENPASEPLISAVTIKPDGDMVTFECTRTEEDSASAEYSLPAVGDILVEPYPSLMKIGAGNLLCSRFGLEKPAANSYVYFGSRSDAFASLGAQSQIIEVMPYASKIIKRFAKKYPKVNIACRNFPITPEQLRKKLGTADGGNLRLVATTDFKENPMLILAQNC